MPQAQTRMTRQRAVILEELRRLKSHPTADELYSVVRGRLPHISLGTVYRNLDFLVESGAARCLEIAGATRRFDGDISDHQHVRCVHCGRIGDVTPPRAVPEVESLQASGFARILRSRVAYDGVCECCARMLDTA